jgi:hypothetical protein
MTDQTTTSAKAELLGSTAAPPAKAPSFIKAEYFTELEAANVLGLAPITLAVWRTLRKGPPYTKVARRILYKKSSLKTWVEAQERAPSAGREAHATA